MLVLSRKRNEEIVIGSGPSRITVTIVEIRGDKVRLGFDAPPDVPVHRLEVFEAIAAGKTPPRRGDAEGGTDERGSTNYRPIPVEEARRIARGYKKNMVVILAYDRACEKTHVTTYGVAPEEKQAAAVAGERCAAIVGADLSRNDWYEDFRHRTEAEWAAERERLQIQVDTLRAERALLARLAAAVEPFVRPLADVVGPQELVAAVTLRDQVLAEEAARSQKREEEEKPQMHADGRG